MEITKEIISRAPGRVCLFGDHQDYLGLPVIASAIDRYISLTAVKNETQQFNLFMQDLNQQRIISIKDSFKVLESRDYYGSVLKVLKRHGCRPNQGFDIHIGGNIPINAGASSSSAIVVAWTRLLLHLFGSDLEITPEQVAQLAFQAEVQEHGEPGGMMDHYAISFGGVIFIDTHGNSSAKRLCADLPGLVLGDSKTSKDTLDLLASIKQKVNDALAIVKVHFKAFNLQSAELKDVGIYKNILPAELIPYFIGAIENHHYTKAAVKEFEKKNPDLKQLGKLMTAHHLVLKEKLKITIPKIDKMIEVALKAGALGAKINGSGGGGSIVVLAPGKEKEVIQALQAVHADAWQVTVDSGARIL